MIGFMEHLFFIQLQVEANVFGKKELLQVKIQRFASSAQLLLSYSQME
jgi:hypothetical protein